MQKMAILMTRKVPMKRVLSISKFNQIAKKNLDILESGKSCANGTTEGYMTNMVEEPGKTRTYELTRVANADILIGIKPGQRICLQQKNKHVAVLTMDEVRVGALSDADSVGIMSEMQAGKNFEAAIKNITPNTVKIFIRKL